MQRPRFKVSNARPDDIELLVRHRLGMWSDIYPGLKARIKKTERLTHKWIGKKLSEGKLVGFVVRAHDGRVAGSGCLWIREDQPRPTSSRIEVPYLMSMYTEKKFRRRGVGRLVVESAVAWCRKHDYDRIELHASKEGRPLYEAFDFEPTNEMRLLL